MNLQQEATQIFDNAKSAYRSGEITAEEFSQATKIPLKDLFLTLYANGETCQILKSDIYIPAFAREQTKG